jgi:hypothetical protein
MSCPRGSWFGSAIAIAALCASSACAGSVSNRYRIELQPTQQGIVAHYQFPEPISHFEFSHIADVIRASDWELRNAELKFAKGVVEGKGAQAFTHFDIALSPDRIQIDRVYPVLSRLGPDGYVLYTPHLLGEGSSKASIYLRDRANVTAISGGRASHRSGRSSIPADRYTYIGPSSYVRAHSDVVVVAPPAFPVWIEQRATTSFRYAVEKYRRELGTSLPTKPLLMLSYDGTSTGANWRGDSTTGYTLSLRFSGEGWNHETQSLQEIVAHFISHETFHFWNAHPAAGDDQPWIHEGSAEYAALLLRPGSSDDAIAENLNACRDEIGADPLRSSRGRMGRAPYVCGATLFWLSDLASGGTSGQLFFTLWKHLLAGANTRHVYSESDVESWLDEQPHRDAVRQLFDIVLSETGVTRWQRLSQLVVPLGIDLQSIPSLDKMRSQVVNHLLIENCPGSRRYGFYTDADTIKLDSDPSCARLPAGTRLFAIEDRNPISQTQAVFDAVSKRCAKHLPIRLNTLTSVLQAGCQNAIAQPETEFRLSRSHTESAVPH